MIERTLIVLKPDAVKKNLEGEIISRYERAGLRVVARKEVMPDKELAERHYAATDEQVIGMGNKTLASARESGNYDEMIRLFETDDPRKIGEQILGWSHQFITSGKVVAFILEGENAISVVRKVTGFTDPSGAEKGTIRGDLAKDSINRANMERRASQNLVHASGNPDEAEREIVLWFGPEWVKK